MTDQHTARDSAEAANSQGLTPLVAQIITLVAAAAAGWTALSGR